MSQSQDILTQLLRSTTAQEVEEIVTSDPFFKNASWVPVGGRDKNNSGRVEGQMKDPENAFVEKITNSIDAILMKKCLEEDVDPTDSEKAPKSLEEAIKRYIGDEKDFDKLREQRSEVFITAEGRKDFPTLTIMDRGEGQEPSRLPQTILGLSNTLKADIAFVYGKYHQGGTAALRFAGQRPTQCFQLVLSRRADSLKPKQADWGFSLVQKVFINSRIASYQYCVDKDKKTFTVPSDFMVELAEKNEFDFPDGTLIKLYDYQLTRSTSIVYGRNSLSEDVNKKLLKPAVPLLLKELRPQYTQDRKLGSIQSSIAGFLRIIKNRPGLIESEFSIPSDLGPLGTKNVHFLILKHASDVKEVETYLDRSEKIFYLENGLSLNTESEGYISNLCQLPNLAKYVLAFIDISDVTPEETNLMHSAREEFADTADYKEVREKLRVVFEDPKLLDLQKAYKNKDIFSTELLDKETNKLLEKALRADEDLLRDLQIGDDLKLGPQKPEEQPAQQAEFEGQYLPTIFELIGDKERGVNENSFALISFKTDAVDTLLDRQNDQGVCEPPASELFSIVRRTPKDGVITFRVAPKKDAEAGKSETLDFSLLVPTKKFNTTLSVKLGIVPKTVFVGANYPSFLACHKTLMKLPLKAERSLAFDTDAANDLFTSGRASVDVQSDDVELTKFQLKNGLLKLFLKCTSEEVGKKQPLRVTLTCDNGISFTQDAPLEIVKNKDEEGFQKPEMVSVGRDGWKRHGWDENGLDIAEVVRDNEGLTVFYNPESVAIENIKNRIRTDDIPKAEAKYRADCYIQALHQFFEFRDEDNYRLMTRRAMKAIGKSMPAMISKQFKQFRS